MRKALRCIAILTLLFVQLQGIFTLNTADVKAQEETVLLNNDAAKVTVTPSVTETAIEWTIDYARYAPSDAAARAIRFKLATAADGSGTVQRKDGDLKEKADGDDWYRESEASTTTAQGKLVVTTAKDVKQLVVWTQVDLVNMGQVTGELLTNDDSTAKVVVAPEIPEEEKQEEIVVDQTPVDTTDPAESLPAAPIQPTEDTKQNATKAPAATDTEKQETVAQPADRSVLTRAGSRTVLARAGSTSNVDPFNYTADGIGKYPTHGTNTYLTTTGTSSSEYVQNYNYAAAKTEGASVVTQALTGTNAFTGGYHAYSDSQLVGYTKKTVSPNADGSFKVQLDMIGNAIKPLPKVDVVLVLDKSSSMVTNNGESGATRWSELKTAVSSFANSMLTGDNNVQIGMTSFESEDGTPWGEIASFSRITSSSTTFSGFTTNASSITSHNLYTATPVRGVAGTPTFLGVDTGLHLLMNQNYGARNDAVKVLITITDGVPTFQPENSYWSSGSGSNTTMKSVESSLGQGTRTVQENNRVRYSMRKQYYSGNGSLNDPGTNTTTQFIQDRYAMDAYTGINPQAIGFYTGTNESAVLNALGKNTNVYKAGNVQDLVSALHAITGEFTATIYNAVMTDPMSEFVTLNQSSVQYNSLILRNGALTVGAGSGTSAPSFAQAITPTVTANQIQLSNVSLGGGEQTQQGYRVTYNVNLKDEYKDGSFYPTNGVTSLKNAASGTDYLHFAVPSVKAKGQTTNIKVNKVWDDKANAYATRKDLVIDLYSAPQGTNDWTKYGSKTMPVGTETVTFNDVPVKKAGKTLQYKAEETVSGTSQTYVPGYALPTYSAPVVATATNPTLTMTNKLNYTKYAFTKTDANGNALKDAKFTVTRNGKEFAVISGNANGEFQLADLPIGEYKVSETTAPDGYLGKVDFNVSVKDNGNAGVTLTSDLKGDTVINDLKPFKIELRKYNRDNKPLEGARFKITGDDFEATAITDENGYLQLKDNETIKPGKYTITEISAPDGYLKYEGEFTLVISEDGKSAKLSYDGSELQDDDYSVESLLTVDKNTTNTVSLVLKNIEQADVPLPLTGGSGLGAFIVIGILLIGTAGYLKLVDWRKKRGGDGNA
jgi:LPXTG-motif cell wall-anchored protein